MDLEILKIIISSVAIPFGLYMLKSINDVKKELHEHKLNVAQNYLTKEVIKELKIEMNDNFRELKKDFHSALNNMNANSINKKGK
ncbi:hypothetical protein [Histophilus somni]|uniref:hypothetical protein n=1 Tax=Histophilus somni TaxID=731 RepID=UPI00201F27E6|nr:hypothetical protein [Histophilus somni]